MLFTAYDFPTAWVLDTHDVNIGLISDSLGLPSTNLDEMPLQICVVTQGAVHLLLGAECPSARATRRYPT